MITRVFVTYISYKIIMENSLPEQCLSVNPYTGEIILLTKGKMGYIDGIKIEIVSNNPKMKLSNHEIVNLLNRSRGISKEQEMAMLSGSMFGWDIPAANPASYNSLE